jgi:hypothetical protein
MAIVKNTNSDYVITCKNGAGNLVINANTEVFGELNCTGAFLTVADHNPGIINYMGMLAQISPNSWAGLRFNVFENRWEASSDVTSDGSEIAPYAPFGDGADGHPSGANMAVQFNNNGAFGGSSDFTFNPITQSASINGYQYFAEQSVDPIGIANAHALYGNTPNLGNSGLYVTSPSGDSQELITAKQALLYSIIF